MTFADDRRRILSLLSEGKITPEEAERLLSAMEGGASNDRTSAPAGNRPRYMRVTVDESGGNAAKVNIRIPIQLLRAGVRLSALIPPLAAAKVNEALRDKGLAFDISQLKPENLDELIDQIGELSVDVDSDQAKVKVFCE
ncbi:MAG: SHOCT-like domain-containing protein [Caulobacteraceae bacterium]